MWWKFLRRSLPLIILGVAIGLAARLIFGVPETDDPGLRKFHRPIDKTMQESKAHQTPDFPLTETTIEKK